MKVLVFILLVPFFASSQYWYKSDTSCYSSQYIAVDISEFSPVPSPLKQSIEGYETGEPDTSDLFNVIYELNRERLLRIYDWTIQSRPGYLSANKMDSIMNNYPNLHILEDPEVFYTPYFYRFLGLNDYIIYDDSGYPLYDGEGQEIRIDEDTIDFYFLNLMELRIHEVFDDRKAKPYIAELGFVAMDDYGKETELFWVDFKELQKALAIDGINSGRLFWYDKLINREYNGFRYRQNPCGLNFER